MMRHCVAALAAFAVAACSAQPVETGSGGAVATASERPSASLPPTAGPVAIEFDVLATERHPLARFGNTELRFVAILGAVGAVDPCFELKPAWLNICGERAVGLFHPDGKDAPPEPGRQFVYGAVHPSLEMESGWDLARVMITAHYDDPAAQDCRYTEWAPRFGPQPSVEETVEMCRSILVITDIELVG